MNGITSNNKNNNNNNKRKKIFNRRSISNNNKSIIAIFKDSADQNQNDYYNYDTIVKNTTQTYEVYSPFLSAFMEIMDGGRQTARDQLKEMYNQGIKISLFTIDPEIIRPQDFSGDINCYNTIISNNCAAYKAITNISSKTPNTIGNNNNDFFSIPIDFFGNYFLKNYDSGTHVDNLIKSLKTITNDDNKELLFLSLLKRYIPFCITFSDRNQENGIVVIDFNIPYTHESIFIEIKKSEHPYEFNLLSQSFEEMTSLQENNEISSDCCRTVFGKPGNKYNNHI